MTIGIDKIGFATSPYVLRLKDLAAARDTDPEKLSKGLLLKEQSVAPITEDIVTLAATAADDILTDEDKEAIDMVILATESGIDQSKAAAVFVHGLLDIQPFARSFEMKEACYAATAALDYAKLHVEKFPQSKVLVIASDIAKYGIGTPGEPTQGAGAVAMLISQNPRILSFNDDNVAQTRDVMDFWRPNYATTPFVNGIYSTQQYLDSLKTTWVEYQKRTGLALTDFAAVCFHLPYPKLALKGLKKILDKSVSEEKKDQLQYNFDQSILYSQRVGNIYTGSLFLGLLSLLENDPQLKAGDRIALCSYGSGAVSEIFSANLVPGFEQLLDHKRMEKLDQRTVLSVSDYERLFYEEVDLDPSGNQVFEPATHQTFALTEIKEHQRTYQKVEKKWHDYQVLQNFLPQNA
ncbi:MAG: hydroxymethylglutaryl-CoA synthase [Streptococcus sp.]